MFVRKLILLCLSIAVLAPLVAAKQPKPAKSSKAHVAHPGKAKIKKGPKVKFGSYKVKQQKHKS